MGVLYHPQPLDDEQFADAEWACWLKRAGIERPSPGEQGRWPTVAELRRVLDAIDGHVARYNVWEDQRGEKFFDVDVRPSIRDQPGREQPQYGPRAPIRVLNFDGGEDKEARFYFEKGALDLNLLVLKHLARLCGPYTLYGDDAVAPVMIDADTDLAAVLAWWGSERVRLSAELVSAAAGERLDSE